MSIPPPAPAPAPDAAPKKPLLRRPWFWVLAVVGLFVVVGIAGAVGGDDGTDRSTAAPSSDEVAQPDDPADAEPASEAEPIEEPAEEPAADPEQPAAASIGQPVEVGDWIVTVVAVGAPVEQVGDQYLNTKAQGSFIPISITAQNAGTGAQLFMASDLVAVDDQGREFEYSSDAAIYAGDAGAAIFDEVNPGNTLAGDLFYDVPDGATLVSLEVAAGLFAQPVTVALR